MAPARLARFRAADGVPTKRRHRCPFANVNVNSAPSRLAVPTFQVMYLPRRTERGSRRGLSRFGRTIMSSLRPPAGLNPETLNIPAPTCGQWTTDLESVFDALGLTDSPPSIHPFPSFESARPNQRRYQRAAIAPWDQPWVLTLVSCAAAAEAACSTLAATVAFPTTTRSVTHYPTDWRRAHEEYLWAGSRDRFSGDALFFVELVWGWLACPGPMLVRD
ncbi:hypothetical protein CSIM01_11415 [Colletotrichum simmondsii]|uniref:Uncharacterized protein n=1 Tax=Colletotrichum simmondsii TaxID=703756 RepID=A0A135RRA7_9PEZI|nr:hypothetical protein CSIM01_11415 [Colletotrichum simmondsii]